MHMQMITWRLKDLSAEDYAKLCDELAPAFAAVPGLVSKVWFADAAENRYGGVYTWESRDACELFMQSELYKILDKHPHLKDVQSRTYDVLDNPTRITRGVGVPEPVAVAAF